MLWCVVDVCDVWWWWLLLCVVTGWGVVLYVVVCCYALVFVDVSGVFSVGCYVLLVVCVC